MGLHCVLRLALAAAVAAAVVTPAESLSFYREVRSGDSIHLGNKGRYVCLAGLSCAALPARHS